MTEKTYTVKRFVAENLMRLNAVDVDVRGQNVVTIGGRNAQGKTSILNAIAMALGGEKAIPDEPVRRGAKSGRVFLDLEDMTVERTFSESGKSRLVVRNKEGATFSSPQTLLDGLTGRLTFDPLEFSRLDKKKQHETLKEMVGLDFSEIDRKRAGLYTDRTVSNRKVDQLKAELAALPAASEPEELIDVSALTAQLADVGKAAKKRDEILARRQAATRAMDSKTMVIQNAKAKIERAEAEISRLQAEIKKDQASLKTLGAERETLAADWASIEDEFNAAVVPDASAINADLERARNHNDRVRDQRLAVASRKRIAEQLEEETQSSDFLTKLISGLDDRKAEMLAKAKFPIAGLGFNESGVTYNGIPFSQASGAEQLRVSFAMAQAMNPKMRIALIRNGSLLDEDGMKQIAQMAEESGMQIWLEVVSSGDGVSIVIEDGMVVENRKAEGATA